MNREKVWFSFFMILALTLNFGFFYGEIDDALHHNVYELFAVVVVNLIATILKFGDRTQMGAMLLATSLVAMVQLIAASLVWAFAEHVQTGLAPATVSTIVALTGGAMVANIISVILLMIETSRFER
jgi:Ca2+/H+ antiporter, TMEM165/GDT1 family